MVREMRAALLCVFAVASCGIPFKYHVFQLPAGQADIIWVFRDRLLFRCAKEPEGPVCAEAEYRYTPEPAEVSASPKKKPVAAPARSEKVEPIRKVDFPAAAPTDASSEEKKGHMECKPRRTGGEECHFVPDAPPTKPAPVTDDF